MKSVEGVKAFAVQKINVKQHGIVSLAPDLLKTRCQLVNRFDFEHNPFGALLEHILDQSNIPRVVFDQKDSQLGNTRCGWLS